MQLCLHYDFRKCTISLNWMRISSSILEDVPSVLTNIPQGISALCPAGSLAQA